MTQYLCILSPPIYLATPTTATYRVCIGVHPDHLTIEGMLRWCREFPPSVDRRFFHGHPPEGWNGADNLGWTNGGIDLTVIFEQQKLQIMKNPSFQTWILHVARKDACYLLFSWMGSNTCVRINLCRERRLPATFLRSLGTRFGAPVWRKLFFFAKETMFMVDVILACMS